MFEADGEAHIAGRHAAGDLRFFRKLRMGRRRRMNGEAARIADIGDMVEEFQRVDEAASRIQPALEFKAEQGAIAALQIFIGAFTRFACLLRRVNHLCDFAARGQEIRDLLRILHMALHAQRHRFDSL